MYLVPCITCEVVTESGDIDAHGNCPVCADSRIDQHICQQYNTPAHVLMDELCEECHPDLSMEGLLHFEEPDGTTITCDGKCFHCCYGDCPSNTVRQLDCVTCPLDACDYDAKQGKCSILS